MRDRRADVLVIGGGVAGVRCVRTLRRLGFGGTIAMAGDEEHPPYNRPPLSKELLRDDVPDDLLLAEPLTWYERRHIDLMLGAEVERLDLDHRVATMSDGSRTGFDRVLIATGAAPRRLHIPSEDGVLMLRTLDDARRLRRAAVQAGWGAPAVVIGGGLIGVEVASGLAALGLHPTILEAGERLWGGAMGTGLAEWAVEALAEAGVEVRFGASVTRLERGRVWVGTTSLPATLVVAGIGVAPRTDLAAAAGLEIEGGILTDTAGRTSHPAAWAAGDVARIRGRPRVEHWHAAREAGERAARSMLAAEVDAIPPAWVFTEVAGVTVDVMGETTGPEERWLGAGRRVRAFLEGDAVVGLASIDGALPSDEARRWVSDRLRVDEIEGRMGVTKGRPTP